MSDRSTRLRRPFALAAALLVTAATFLVASSGPVAAGRPMEFNVTPSSAEVGDIVTTASDVNCSTGDNIPVDVEVTLLDSDDTEVATTSGTSDTEGNWSFDIDTAGLDAGTFTVKARCIYGEGQWNNYQSQTLTLTAPDVEPTTTTTEAETTTSTTETPTTDVPGTTTTPTVDEEPNAAPAAAVAGSPNYTG